MRSQKKKTQASRAEWALAVKEGRVLRFEGGLRAVSYPTFEMRDRALAEAKAAGIEATIVHVPDTPNAVVSDSGQVVARARTAEAAHRTTRKANMAGTRVDRRVKHVDDYEVWTSGATLLYHGPNESEARRTFVRAAIPDMQAFARAMGLGEKVSYPPLLELRGVTSRGKTVSSLMADTITPHRMMELDAKWNAPSARLSHYGRLRG
jgi:hypothetical protein